MEILNAWEPFLVFIGSLIAGWRFGIVYEDRERWIFLDTLMVFAFAGALAGFIVEDVRLAVIATPGDLLARGLGHAFDAAGFAGVPAAFALVMEGYKREPRKARREAPSAHAADEPVSQEQADDDDPAFGLDPERFAKKASKSGAGRRPSNDN